METMVRMGELAVSHTAGHLLTSLGLGSCIGLALVDRRKGIAGLAHIVLPQSEGHGVDNPRKFADLAVPELVVELEAAGARRIRLQAALAGGASMFASAAKLEVGQRNESAVRGELKRLRIPVVATSTGGSRGRTIRVDSSAGTVTVRVAGGADETLVPEAVAVAA